MASKDQPYLFTPPTVTNPEGNPRPLSRDDFDLQDLGLSTSQASTVDPKSHFLEVALKPYYIK